MRFYPKAIYDSDRSTIGIDFSLAHEMRNRETVEIVSRCYPNFYDKTTDERTELFRSGTFPNNFMIAFQMTKKNFYRDLRVNIQHVDLST